MTVALAAVAGACGRPPAPAPAVVPAVGVPAATMWRTLGTWSGRGNQQTESFDVVTGSLRLRWEAVNERAPGAGRLTVALHSAISGRALQTIVDHRGVGAAAATLSDEPRTSYLEVEAADVEWRLTLEEAVSGQPARTARP